MKWKDPENKEVRDSTTPYREAEEERQAEGENQIKVMLRIEMS